MDGSNGKPGGQRTNVIDQGTSFKGNLASRTTVVVMGVMEGEISGPALQVERTGLVLGKAKTGELRARGELSGEFEADDMELHGRVRDHTVLRARTLVVGAGHEGEPGAVFGECQIEIGDVPSKEQTIKAFLTASRPPAAAAVPGGEPKNGPPERPVVTPLTLVEAT